MTSHGLVSPTQRSVRKYYETLEGFRNQRVSDEMNVRSAFQSLLADTARLKGWTLVPELSAHSGGSLVRPDATLRDANSLPRGYWEAKDTKDDLDSEIRRKIAHGYSLSNTIFEDTQTGVLYQNKQEVRRVPLGDPKELARLLNQFYGYAEPDIEGFEEAVEEFQERVPELARGLADKIREAHKDNPRFIEAFAQFFTLCQTALNPNIRVEAVDEMLVQHLLTERLIRTIFDNPDFTNRNAIAQEVKRVIDALVSQSFSQQEYLKKLDRFYVAIEQAARTLTDFSEKQHFLNSVYERFFQGYSVKVADTHGIVYTPQPIVDFMCASVAEVLEKEFGKSLSSSDVYIIDPCTGTGNFIVNLLRRISKRDLPRVYREQLFANEVMLLPYYIAALNIEHAYYDLTGAYEPFEGLCFVDTLDLAEGSQTQLGFMNEANTRRVERQKRTPITVVIGNPPYNMNQQNENDNNKNRKYAVIDRRVSETYAKASKASNKNALSDPYVKFFRWATDRLQGRDGIVAFVSNNSFVDQYAFDGMRKHLLQDFTEIYHVDLHGNVRRNPKLSGTTHNVFGIQVGVGITLAIRKKGVAPAFRPADVGSVAPPDADLKVGATRAVDNSGLGYHRVPEDWRKEQKLGWLVQSGTVASVKWTNPKSAPDNSWLATEHADEFQNFMALASKAAKVLKPASLETIFKTYSVGVKTNHDEVVYDFQAETLIERVRQLIEDYNGEVDRYKRSDKKISVDEFVNYRHIKWSGNLKLGVTRGNYAVFEQANIRRSLYRAYCRRTLFFDRLLNERVYRIPLIFPTDATEKENRLICCTIDSQMPFSALVTDVIPSHAPGGRPGQCFPFYVYNEDGTNRRENVTDWALEHFRERYGDKKITKWDIFHYVYGVLHHPAYRAKFAENLKRELPRIPLIGACHSDPSADGEESRPVPRRESGTKNPALKNQSEIPRSARDDRPPQDCKSTGHGSATGFWAVANAGKELADLHIDYEKLEPYPLKFVETPSVAPGFSPARAALKGGSTVGADGVRPKAERRSALPIPLSYRVEDKMRLSKDRKSLKMNESLTLAGIPPEAFEYRLGNRSALEWVIDQYQVTEDKHSGIRSDSNRPDDPEYIVRLVGQVVRVSLETVRLVSSLPALVDSGSNGQSS
jgi:predicted helicase